jgi:coenzyme Q-binding protein COQ10
VTESGPQVLEAELTVGFLSFKESYVSTVTCIPNESVKVCPVFLVPELVLNPL